MTFWMGTWKYKLPETEGYLSESEIPKNTLWDVFGRQFVHQVKPTQRFGTVTSSYKQAHPDKVITHPGNGAESIAIQMRRPGTSNRVSTSDLDTGEKAFWVQVPGKPVMHFSNREQAEAYYWREHDRLEAKQKARAKERV
jgi:hypothetical protein